MRPIAVASKSGFSSVTIRAQVGVQFWSSRQRGKVSTWIEALMTTYIWIS
jgi:hypothetical protein